MLLLLTTFSFSLCISTCQEYEQAGKGTSVVTGNTELWPFLVLLLLNIFPLFWVIAYHNAYNEYSKYIESNSLFGKKHSMFGRIAYS